MKFSPCCGFVLDRSKCWKACGTWAYISSSWVVTNLLRLFKLPLITICKVPGTVGHLKYLFSCFLHLNDFFLGVGLVRDPLLLSLAQTLPWKLVGTNCHLKDGAFLDPKPSRNPPMIQVCPLKIFCPARAMGELSQSKLASHFWSLILLALWMRAIHIIAVPKYKAVR